MNNGGELGSSRPWRRGVAGATAAAVALAHPATLIGGIAWAVAFVIACSGFGVAIERATRQRVSEGLTVVVGFGFLLLGSMLVASAGFLGRSVQFALVGVGLAASLLPRTSRAEPLPRRALAIAAVAGIALVGIALVRRDPVVADGVNHAFVIKRLWDLGSLGSQHHQLGVQLVGESYATLLSGADAAGVFEPGLCAALLLGLFATELAATRDRHALVRFGFVALPIALQPGLTQWSAVVLQLAAFWSLGPAIAARRTGWHTIIAALGLIALRHEYVMLGVPYLVAAIALPRQPRITWCVLAVALAGWLALVIVVEIALAVGPASAALGAALLLAAIPMTALVLRLSGMVDWRSPLAVLWFGMITTGLALVLEAIRSAQHSPATGAALWLSTGIAMLGAIDPPPVGAEPAPRLGVLGMCAVLAVFVATMDLAPAYDTEAHGRVIQRFLQAAIVLRDRLRIEPSNRAHADARALQELVPMRARLGFWGRGAAQLDFRRNVIRDVSWPPDVARRREVYYLVPLQRANLFALDYLIVEDLPPNAYVEPWADSVAPATSEVEGYLERIASTGATQLYRVKR